MKPQVLFIAFSSCILINCGSQKAEQGESTDSSSTEIQASDSIDSSNANIQTYILQWKEIVFVEGNLTYYLNDKDGKVYSFNYFEVPGFDFQNSKYFNYITHDDRPFPDIIPTEEATAFFKITIKKELREMEDGSNDWREIIVGMEEVLE